MTKGLIQLMTADVTARGSFGFQSVLGVTDSNYPPGSHATPIMGCPVAGQHLWAGLQVGGRRVLPIRHFMNEMAGRFLVYDGEDGEQLSYNTAATGYSGLCNVGDYEGGYGITQPSREPRFRFTVAADGSGRWVERGTIDLHLRLDPDLPALQFACPDANEPLVYLARPFRVVSGTVLGEQVDDGLAFHEQVYVRSGQGWALTKYKKQLQGTWIAFATRYEDGHTDWGQLCWGTRGWSFAIIVRSTGEHITVHRPAAEMITNDAGRVVGFDFDLGTHGAWTWRPPRNGGGEMVLPGPAETTPQWSEGIVAPAELPAPVAFAHTWAETYPHNIG